MKLKLEPEGKFYFSATSGAENIPYEIDINLYDKVDMNVSANMKNRTLVCVCMCSTFMYRGLDAIS